ncbi:MAG: hypothetical protein AAFX05_13840, partial [Planctomycetota bacterium]
MSRNIARALALGAGLAVGGTALAQNTQCVTPFLQDGTGPTNYGYFGSNSILLCQVLSSDATALNVG